MYEGFGLPVLEALACGALTITSNTSSLPEVVGDAALLIDPTSEAEIADAIEQLLSNMALRNKLRERAIFQAGKFTWERTADLTALAYTKTAALLSIEELRRSS